MRELVIWGGLLLVALGLGFAGTRTPPAAAEAPEVPGYDYIAFDRLASYPYVVPDPGSRGPTGQIPPEVSELDGSSVLISGFVVPLDVLDGRVPEFYLSRFPQGCCFGRPVDGNELVYVDLGGESVPFRPHRPVWLRGRLEVGENYDAAGYLMHVYRLVDAAVVRFDAATGHDPTRTRSTPGAFGPGSETPGPEAGTRVGGETAGATGQ